MSNIRLTNWEIGQVLLPEHFTSQENSLIAQSVTRQRVTGLPAYGLINLTWDQDLLTKGLLSIQSLSLIMPSGSLLAVGDNASVEAFDLTVLEQSQVKIYLHVLSDKKVNSQNTENGILKTLSYKLILTPDEVVPDAVEKMVIGEFNSDVEGAWHVSHQFIPPFLKLGQTPFLKEKLVSLDADIGRFQSQLEKDISVQYISGDSLFNVQKCLEAIFSFRLFIKNIQSQINVHPYYLYEQLLSVYAMLKLYHKQLPERNIPTYKHDDLSGSLLVVVNKIIELLATPERKVPYLQFQREAGMMVLKDIPAHVRQASEVYVLLHKDSANNPVDLSSFKLASLRRLPTVRKNALKGLNIERMLKPRFQHEFSNEVDFYLIKAGEEWDYIVSEGAMAIYDHPELANMQLYLYWRHI